MITGESCAGVAFDTDAVTTTFALGDGATVGSGGAGVGVGGSGVGVGRAGVGVGETGVGVVTTIADVDAGVDGVVGLGDWAGVVTGDGCGVAVGPTVAVTIATDSATVATGVARST
jgi:hypothetical protein